MLTDAAAMPRWTPFLLLSTAALAQHGHDLPSLEQPWQWPVLYANPHAEFIQEFALQGRFQLQWAEASAGGFNYGSGSAPEFTTWGDVEVRRWRLGARVRFLHNCTIDGHVNIRPDLDPVYLATYDLQFTWSRDPSFAIVIGKTKVPYTQEYAISSARIATFERSLLTNQVITTPLTGVAAFGTIANWRYRAGVYANDPQPFGEFSRFDAGIAFVGKLAYDFGHLLGCEQAWFGGDVFVHSEPPANGQPPYMRSAALTAEGGHGRLGWLADVLWSGGEGIDNHGVTLLPTWRLCADWQLALRYHVAWSRGGDGLAPPIRYDRFEPDIAAALTADGRGDFSQSAYLGLNWFLHGHHLKLMTGVEYFELRGGEGGGGYDNWTVYTGLRYLF